MATGVRRRHSAGCPAKGKTGRRCRCKAGWIAEVYSPRTGKVRKTFRTEAEGKTWRADAQVAMRKGVLTVSRDRRALGEALTELVDGMEAGTIRPRGRREYAPNTVRSYGISVDRHLIPALGAVKVTELRRSDVQDFADELLADYEPGTVLNTLCPLRTLYGRLEDRDEIAYNPTTRLDLPAKSSLRPTRIATPGEAAALIAALPASDRPLRATAFYAGLRRGELQALRASDVDLSGEIRVERGWDQEAGVRIPKYESVRTVPLLAVLRDYLDQHIIESGRSGEELIFGRSASQPFAPMTVDKRARKAWEAAGMERITLHDCRHTFASMLIEAGENAKAIQTVMGHKKIATTFDTYGHLLDGALDQMRSRMDTYLAHHPSLTGTRTGTRADLAVTEELAR